MLLPQRPLQQRSQRLKKLQRKGMARERLIQRGQRQERHLGARLRKQAVMPLPLKYQEVLNEGRRLQSKLIILNQCFILFLSWNKILTFWGFVCFLNSWHLEYDMYFNIIQPIYWFQMELMLKWLYTTARVDMEVCDASYFTKWHNFAFMHICT